MKAAALLADAVLVAHALVVAFVVFGQLFVTIGGLAGWRWVRRRSLRVLHLGLMTYVVVQAWFGITCPLTSLERSLREAAGQAAYQASFIEYWLTRLIFYQAPGWVFVVVYTTFLLLVALSWWYWPPVAGRRAPPRTRD